MELYSKSISCRPWVKVVFTCFGRGGEVNGAGEDSGTLGLRGEGSKNASALDALVATPPWLLIALCASVRVQQYVLGRLRYSYSSLFLLR